MHIERKPGSLEPTLTTTRDDDACVASLFRAPPEGVVTAIDISARASPEVVAIMTLAALATAAPEVYATPAEDCFTNEIYDSVESQIRGTVESDTANELTTC